MSNIVPAAIFFSDPNIKHSSDSLSNLQRSDLPWQVESIEIDCKERQLNSAWEIAVYPAYAQARGAIRPLGYSYQAV